MSSEIKAALHGSVNSPSSLRNTKTFSNVINPLPLSSRRGFLKQTGIIGLAALLAGCVPLQPLPHGGAAAGDAPSGNGGGLMQVELPDFAGSVFVADRGGAKIHTYMAPVDANANGTHVIESENSLVLVDAQFMVPFAQEFRGYVDGLGKPIDRIIISHSHPDHFWGLSAAFEDVPAYALAETIGAIEEGGQIVLDMQKPEMGDLAPDTVRVPEDVVVAGTETIDGITYEMKHYTDAEDTDQLVIQLPELSTIILQDLAYNDIHLFTAANLENWAAHVEGFKGMSQFTLGLAGHGMPFEDMMVYDNVLGYLQTAGEILGGAESMEDYITAIAEAYPDYQGNVHEIAAGFLFGEM